MLVSLAFAMFTMLVLLVLMRMSWVFSLAYACVCAYTYACALVKTSLTVARFTGGTTTYFVPQWHVLTGFSLITQVRIKELINR